MSRVIRILTDGSLISAGASPADIRQGVVGYSQRPADKDKLTIDWTGYLDGDTIDTITWTPASLTVTNETNSDPITSALISDVPECGRGALDVSILTTTDGREKTITIWFYGYSVVPNWGWC